MVEITVRGNELQLEIKGLDKLWSFRNRITIALDHIREVRAVASAAELRELMGELGFAIRAPGTHLPFVITAGTYYYFGEGRVFVDVHHPVDSTILLELEDEPFRKLIVDVDDPDDAIHRITEALAAQAG